MQCFRYICKNIKIRGIAEALGSNSYAKEPQRVNGSELDWIFDLTKT